MIPGVNPKMLKQAMKKMGMRQEGIDAYEVIIKTHDGDYSIRNPEVMRVVMMGQESLQITGEMERIESGKPDDVKLVMEQAKCSEDEARKALEKSGGDIAQAILGLEQ